MIDYRDIKLSISEVLRDGLYPRQTVYDSSISTSTGIEVAQSIYTFSSLHNRSSIELDLVLSKVGNPTEGLRVSLDSGDSYPETTVFSTTIDPSAIPTSPSTVTCTLPVSSKLGTYTRYWIHISPLHPPSPTDYYWIYYYSDPDSYLQGGLKSKSDTNWTDVTGDLCFNLKIPNFVYVDYPYERITKYSFPRVVVSLEGRPRVDQRYIDYRRVIYSLLLQVAIFSRIPAERDELLSLVDQTIFNNRASIENIWIVSPARILPPRVEFFPVAGQVFSQRVQYEILYMMTST